MTNCIVSNIDNVIECIEIVVDTMFELGLNLLNWGMFVVNFCYIMYLEPRIGTITSKYGK